ncbi:MULTISPECIES: HAMP domain-containing sensor histidine kinase [Paraburkholderia]|nr:MULTISPECIES: HAMP domain-containing sensor histidine kinase [Paraburkholderia]MCX4160262.1 HAMP domain-containing sensor histidine kinase [Paraburkholderia megapolitana]MDN7155761.1 HAMP domain-containing histidine kinase [Paraburkholderia sp. CHISQ3]MDQ6492805.1 HAMP domain-containing histidine kinase [Paraburkholderia megapolitana]QDQ85921.1 HAMP domain-containing histidine kinase [Paraburkholderia megapolitana]
MLLLGFIGWAVTGDMERETDVPMDWQLIYLDSMPQEQLADAIHRRLEHERMHTNFYGLFSADGQHIAGDILKLPPELAGHRRGRTLEHTLVIEGDQHAPVVRAMAERMKSGETLVVARDLTHILNIRETIINALVGGGIFCLAAGIAGGLGLSVRQMRRLKAIRRVTQRIAQGDLGQRLPIGGRDEIDMLSHLVNHMLAEVERLMNEVKSVCDGIAHDLRTPLAHVRTLLAHIAEQTDKLDEAALSGLVDRARGETDGLLNRFRAMLRISEIGTLQRRGGFGEVQLETLVREVGELYEPLAESRTIELLVQASPVAPIHGDHALLFEALSNLLDNALKFTEAGGTVRVVLTQTPLGPQVEIVDNGPGIAANERDAVLQRFYRGESTRHITGSGLGLSIVSAIVHVHDFTMRIGNADPGTRVTIECWMKTLE